MLTIFTHVEFAFFAPIFILKVEGATCTWVDIIFVRYALHSVSRPLKPYFWYIWIFKAIFQIIYKNGGLGGVVTWPYKWIKSKI